MAAPPPAVPGGSPSPHARRHALVFVAVAAALLGSPACRRFTKEGADQEVYGILDTRRPDVPEVAGSLDVDRADRAASAGRAAPPPRLSLADALRLSATTSRDALEQREDVYLSALRLTTERNRYRWKPELVLGAGVTATRDDVNPEGSLGASVDRDLEDGGSVVLDLATGFLAALATGDPFQLARTVLSTEVLVPLARGSGWVAREPLIQAERDVLYALRDYARFQQELVVSIATEHYRVLEERDTWRNEERTLESLRQLLARQEALGAAEAGRLSEFEVDQTRQNLLVAENRTQVAKTRYESALDGYKLTLGVPIGAAIEPLDDDLEALRRAGPLPSPVPAEDAVPLALRSRLDLRNAIDEEQDARRKVLVAKDRLGPQADLVLGGLLRRNAGETLDIAASDLEGLAAVSVGLPLERTAERNAFRTTILEALRARRDREAFEDRVTLAAREALRQLERARQSHEIESEGVRLAERRVESTDLLLEAGQATTRDRLEAEDALVGARNALTRALVDHAIARLVLERDVGLLTVAEDGTIEGAAPPTPEPLGSAPAAPPPAPR